MAHHSNRSSLPFQITFGNRSPSSWRLQINNGHGDNQRVLLSQWLQGQNSQARPQVDGVERSLQINEASPPPPDSPSQDVAVDLTPPSNDEAAGNRVNAPQPATPNASAQGGSNNNNNNPFAAIQLLLEQNPEMYNIFQTCLSYIPFILLIFLNEIYKHTSDLLVIAALVVTFIHANNTVQKEVTKQGKRELRQLAAISLNILACAWFVYYMFGETGLYHTLLLFPPNHAPVTLSNLFWIVTTTDGILKLATVLLKAILTAFPVGMFPISKRGKCFVFLERSSQLYRALAAVPPWILYLLSNSSAEGTTFFFYDWLVGICLCAVYLTCKAYKAVKLLKKWKLSLAKLFQSTNYGNPPSTDELTTAGPMCAICHDVYRNPTCLGCKHVFCEECLALWLDQERTCPMCRSTVAEDPKWKDGTTSYMVQLF